MVDKYHERIKELLEQNGAMGVNALSRVLGINLSTLQKYLHKQTYFKQTAQRKWDLPSTVASSLSNVDSSTNLSIIESQVTGINALMGVLSAQLNSTLVLISSHRPSNVVSVEKQSTVHPRFLELHSNVEQMLEVYKKYVRVVPEEYQNLLKNLDLYSLTVKKGTEYLNSVFNVEISALMLEKTDTLSESVTQILKEYQNV